MHVEAKAVNWRDTTHNMTAWDPWRGAYTVPVPMKRFDLVGKDGKPLPAMGDGDSFSFSCAFTYE